MQRARLNLLFALLSERTVDFIWVIFSQAKSTQDFFSSAWEIFDTALNHPHAFTLILIILGNSWKGKTSIPSWTHQPSSRKQNKPKSSPNAACLSSDSSCGRNRAETEVPALKRSAAKLGFFFWGFLCVYVTVFRVMACVIWGFIRGNGEWSGFTELIWLWWTSASLHIQSTDIHILCNRDEDKNSNRDTVRLSMKERQKEHGMRKTAMKRYVQTSRLRYAQRPAVSWAGLATCLAAFWASEISSSLIIPHAVRLSLSVCLVRDGRAGERASVKFAPSLKGQERDAWDRETGRERSAWKDEKAKAGL